MDNNIATLTAATSPIYNNDTTSTTNNNSPKETRLTTSAAAKVVVKENRQKFLLMWGFVFVFYIVSTFFVENAQVKHAKNNVEITSYKTATKPTLFLLSAINETMSGFTVQDKNNTNTHNDTIATTSIDMQPKHIRIVKNITTQQQIDSPDTQSATIALLSNASITQAAAAGLPILPDSYLTMIRAKQRIEQDSNQCVGINREKSNTTTYDQYYYLHIPKVGGSTMHNWLSSNGAWVHNSGRGSPLGGKNGKHSLNKLCQQNPLRRVFMTEGDGFNIYRPRHSLVVFRNPQTHVISQFFHCTESKDHQRYAKVMPQNITIWLEYWNEQLQTRSLDLFRVRSNNARWHDAKYACYNPVNLQSWLAGFPTTKQELSTWFDAVGVQSHFKQSFCVIIVTVIGYVPRICNCTNGPPPPKEDQEKKNKNKKKKRSEHYGHGVTHHGDSFEITPYQQELISNITTVDQQIYKWAEELFQEKLEYIEKEYNVTLCDV